MRIALVVQRYGREVVGGSETLARQYGGMLAEHCDVEVLTTCALDHVTWDNYFPEGVTTDSGVTVRRFRTDFLRTIYWGRLYEMLKGRMDERAFAGSEREKTTLARRLARWPRALQEEVIYWQGPCCSGLFEHLSHERTAYDLFLFFTYLFPTTYFGIQMVPGERAILCPTLHDEPMAYLPVMRGLFQRPRFTIFLSEAERRLGEGLVGFRGASAVIGMAVGQTESSVALPSGTPSSFVLYAGRIEPSKGTDMLIECFCAYKERHPSDLKLVLIGAAGTPIPRHADVHYLGFVSEAQKAALMRRARVFIHPSPYESFSIVLLESFLQGTPALVNGQSQVLTEHCRRSGAGEAFGSLEDFVARLHALLGADERRQTMGERGQRYVTDNFTYDRVADQLLVSFKEAGHRPLSLDRASHNRYEIASHG
jgi:hypothetical protein